MAPGTVTAIPMDVADKVMDTDGVYASKRVLDFSQLNTVSHASEQREGIKPVSKRYVSQNILNPYLQYYVQKIEEMSLLINEKQQNLRRLEAQRNTLNAKGNGEIRTKGRLELIVVYSAKTKGRVAIAATTWIICW